VNLFHTSLQLTGIVRSALRAASMTLGVPSILSTCSGPSLNSAVSKWSFGPFLGPSRPFRTSWCRLLAKQAGLFVPKKQNRPILVTIRVGVFHREL